MLPTIKPVETESWRLLTIHFLEMQATHLRELFAEDTARFEKFSIQFEDILIDYSKNLVNADTMRHLMGLAGECELEEAIREMFNGHRINQTEKRPVLHVALR